jgi:hypothetical protein
METFHKLALLETSFDHNIPIYFAAFEEPQTSHEGLDLRGPVRLREAEGVSLAQPVPEHLADVVHPDLPDIIRIRQRRGGEQQHRSGAITRNNFFLLRISLAQIFQLIYFRLMYILILMSYSAP